MPGASSSSCSTSAQEQLTVQSPIAGQVITWDAEEAAAEPPGRNGPGADDDRRGGHRLRSRAVHARAADRAPAPVPARRSKASDPNDDLEVDFILMTDPGVYALRQGACMSIRRAEPHEEHGNMVPHPREARRATRSARGPARRSPPTSTAASASLAVGQAARGLGMARSQPLLCSRNCRSVAELARVRATNREHPRCLATQLTTARSPLRRTAA